MVMFQNQAANKEWQRWFKIEQQTKNGNDGSKPNQ
jgi:hypothetical protein